jgi:hypothetical protein
MNWIDQIDALGVMEAGKRLGLRRIDRGHLSPCPACSGERRSRTDDRPGAVFLVGDGKGWRCGLCSAGGHTLRLVSYALGFGILAKGDPRWADLKVKAAEAGLCAASWAEPWQPPPPPRPEPRRRVGADELAALWERSARPNDDLEVATWLRSRGLDPDLCAERDLCRALPAGALPRWAIFRGAPWSLGWRCLVRAYDASGALASIRARWVKPTPPPSGGEKTGAAAGGAGSAGAAVIACGLGQQVLARGRPPTWWPEDRPLQMIVVEGEPDWLTWGIRMHGECAPAVLGVFNGAWVPELSERIPLGTQVVVATHHDEPGEKYAKRITEALQHRCRVLRSRRPDARV